jgi:Protein of unknown function (DUF2752)
MMTLPARLASCRSPLMVAALGVAAVAFVAFVDPHVSGRYPPCPWHAVTGLWCPGCGGLRATHDLAHGDLTAAVASNVLVVILIPAIALMWSRWVVQRWRGDVAAVPSLSARTLVLVGVVALIFTVARNLPAGAALAP